MSAATRAASAVAAAARRTIRSVGFTTRLQRRLARRTVTVAAAAARATSTPRAVCGAARAAAVPSRAYHWSPVVSAAGGGPADTGGVVPRMTILYGSQTGTAMGFAQELRKAARKHKIGGRAIDVRVSGLDEFDARTLVSGAAADAPGLVVLLTACFGKGEPTDNARAFHRWLMAPERERDDAAGAWARVHFAQFGLGQSTHYPDQYQRVTKQIEQRLLQLNAKPLLPRGEGDASNDIESDFDAWSGRLWQALEHAEAHDPALLRAVFSPPQAATAADTGAAATATGAAALAAVASTATGSHATAAPTNAPAGSSGGSSTATSSSASPTGSGSGGTATAGAAGVGDVRRPRLCTIRVKREICPAILSTYAGSGMGLVGLDGGVHSCLHLEFEADPAGPPLRYSTGDYLGVFPHNEQHLVEVFAQRLGLDLSERIDLALPQYQALAQESARFTVATDPVTGARTVTVGQVLTRYVDFQCIPRRAVLRALSRFAADPAEARKLEFMSGGSALGQSDYQLWVVRGRRTVLDVIRAFPSVKAPNAKGGDAAAWLLDALPVLQARYYSISSSALVQPHRIAITANVVSYPVSGDRVTATPGGHHPQRRGVCTHYLSQRAEGDRCLVFVKSSLFRLPQGADAARPVVMIAAGSGVAPFRAFVQERAATRTAALALAKAGEHAPAAVLETATSRAGGQDAARRVASCHANGRAPKGEADGAAAPAVGDDVLFFGIRHPEVDFLYRDEVIAAADRERERGATNAPPPVTASTTAAVAAARTRAPGFALEVVCSHTQPWLCFVQHRLIEPEHARRVWQLLHRDGAFLYVCGDAQGLAVGVHSALLHIAATEGGLSETDAEAYLKQLQAVGRYQLDVF